MYWFTFFRIFLFHGHTLVDGTRIVQIDISVKKKNIFKKIKQNEIRRNMEKTKSCPAACIKTAVSLKCR